MKRRKSNPISLLIFSIWMLVMSTMVLHAFNVEPQVKPNSLPVIEQLNSQPIMSINFDESEIV